MGSAGIFYIVMRSTFTILLSFSSKTLSLGVAFRQIILCIHKRRWYNLRNMAGSSDEQDVPRRRTPRRRTAVSREEREVREPRISRRSTVRRAPARQEEVVEEPAPKKEPEITAENRKAPTPLSADKLAEIKKRKRTITAMVLMLIGIGASAAVGLTDQGRIDVQQVIEERNERIRNNRPDERDIITSTVQVPVQDTDTQGKADGGLIGRGTGGRAPEPAPAAVASSTASSTDLVASSTEAVASSTEAVGETNEEAQPEVAPQEDAGGEVTQ